MSEKDWTCFECGEIFDEEDLILFDGLWLCKYCYDDVRKPYRVIFKAAYKPHEPKRPTQTHEFGTLEAMIKFLREQLISAYQLGGTLEEYKIIIKKELGLE